MENLDINTLEQKRQELYAEMKKKTRLPLYAMPVSIIAGVIYIFINFLYAFLLIFIVPFLLFLINIKIRNKYKSQMKGLLFDKIFEMMNLPLKYGDKEKIYEFIRKTRKFISKNFTKKTEDVIYGELDGLPFAMGDVLIEDQTDDDEISETIFRGLIAYVIIPQNLPLLSLSPDIAEKYLGKTGKFLNKISTRQLNQKNIYFDEDPIFEKLFVVWTKDEIFAKQTLTPQVRSYLVAQAERHPVYLTIENNAIFVGLETGNDSFKIKMKEPISQNFIDSMKNEFMYFFNLVKEIKDIILSGGTNVPTIQHPPQQ